jgi:hypothetical protein
MGPVLSTSSTTSLTYDFLMNIYKNGDISKIEEVKKRFDKETNCAINTIKLPNDIIKYICTFLDLDNIAIKYVIQKLDIILYISEECYWCTKTINLLGKENLEKHFKIIDVHYQNHLTAYTGANVIPYFFSNTMNKGIVGYRDSIDEVLVELNK